MFINIILVLSYFNEWYPSDHNAQQYTNNKWNNAECIDLNETDDNQPIIYDQELNDECSFAYPDSNGQYNNTYWSCCSQKTCTSAYDYTQLMIGYNLTNSDSNSYKCWIDMNAMTKASCHPIQEWFVPNEFNISAKPQQKVNKLAVCALFCKKTYDDCGDMIWNDNNNLRVKQIWTRYDKFCEKGLGTNIRYEAFTDKCFAGSQQICLHFSIMVVMINVLFQCN